MLIVVELGKGKDEEIHIEVVAECTTDHKKMPYFMKTENTGYRIRFFRCEYDCSYGIKYAA